MIHSDHTPALRHSETKSQKSPTLEIAMSGAPGHSKLGCPAGYFGAAVLVRPVGFLRLHDKLRQASRIELVMFPKSGESTCSGPDDFLVVGSIGSPMNHYRIKDGKLQFRVIRECSAGEWRTLTVTDVLMHLVLKTDVGEWLYARRGLHDSALKKSA